MSQNQQDQINGRETAGFEGEENELVAGTHLNRERSPDLENVDPNGEQMKQQDIDGLDRNEVMEEMDEGQEGESEEKRPVQPETTAVAPTDMFNRRVDQPD